MSADASDRLIRARCVCLPPSSVSKGFSNLEAVDSSGKGVESDDDVHAVLANGVLRNCLELGLLLSVVQLRPGNDSPRRVGCKEG